MLRYFNTFQLFITSNSNGRVFWQIGCNFVATQTRRIHQSPQGPQQHFVCPYGNQLINVCINRLCTTGALFCQKKDCPACSKAHINCEQVKVTAFQSLIQKRKDQHQQFLSRMLAIQSKMFEAMKQRANGYIQNAVTQVIDKKYMQLVDGVYYKKTYIAVKGSQTEDFYFSLTNPDKKGDEAKQNVLKNMETELQKLASSLKNLQKKSISEYVKSKGVNLQHSVIKSQLSNSTIRDVKLLEIDSKILTKNKYSQLKFILQNLDAPRNLQLIFRASANGFKASRFHLNCDNIPHTLTLIRTQFGKTIAGYTPLTWNSSKGFTNDESGKSFLLLLQSKQKLSLAQTDKAIQCIPSCGPVFGGGSDIAIADECNVGSKSCTHFPYSYNIQGKYSYNQEAWTALCGVPHGKYFNVVEYEVYRVQW